MIAIIVSRLEPASPSKTKDDEECTSSASYTFFHRVVKSLIDAVASIRSKVYGSDRSDDVISPQPISESPPRGPQSEVATQDNADYPQIIVGNSLSHWM